MGIFFKTPSTHAPVFYWLQGESRQNFGDFLSELFLERALGKPRIPAAAYHLVGSVLDNNLIADDLANSHATPDAKIAYWGCGLRQDQKLAENIQSRAIFCGVRGPLTRDLLELPANTVMGDPGFLVPLLHKVRRSSFTAEKSVCVPHYHDTRSDNELVNLAKADVVLRPWTENSLKDLERILDDIASSKFVLTASLHAAIVACAYGVPFAFWDNGFLDLPFKWRDLAASIGIDCCFADHVQDGMAVYDTRIKPQLRLPKLLPILKAAPFSVRFAITARAAMADKSA